MARPSYLAEHSTRAREHTAYLNLVARLTLKDLLPRSNRQSFC